MRRSAGTHMKDPFGNLEHIQRYLGHVAIEITHLQLAGFELLRGWQPAVNVFRCGAQFIVCVELAGVDQSAIDLRAESRRLAIRGTRALAEPTCDDPPALQVLALEIDHGRFERILDLPADIDPQRVTAEHRHGLLWIKLPLRAHA